MKIAPMVFKRENKNPLASIRSICIKIYARTMMRTPVIPMISPIIGFSNIIVALNLHHPRHSAHSTHIRHCASFIVFDLMDRCFGREKHT